MRKGFFSNNHPLIMGFIILFLLSNCSPTIKSKTHPPSSLFTPTTIQISPSIPEQSSTGVDEVITLVEELAIQEQFSGAVLIAKGNEVVWEYAAGLADREANIPNRIDTKFNLGSMNKMFTAVAITQLMEQNKLNLDDTIAKHIPDYPNSDIANQVTIHQLLTHTSGLI